MKFYEIVSCWHSNGHRMSHPLREETLALVQTQEELEKALKWVNKRYRCHLTPEVGASVPAGVQRTVTIKEREVTFRR